MRSPLSGWRRVATAMWHAPDDPQIFGALEIDAAPLLALIARLRADGHHVTATHVVGRAIGHALAAVPELNVAIHRSRVRQRKSVDVFFIASVKKGSDLSGVKVSQVTTKSVVEVAEELGRRTSELRGGADRQFARTKRVTDGLPTPLLRGALRIASAVTNDLGLDLPSLGLPREPFGSAMVSNVGPFGLPQGFAPLAWMYDVPLLVLVGEIARRPVVVADRVVVGDVLPITATIDHRYADGSHISRLMNAFREYLATPERFEPR